MEPAPHSWPEAVVTRSSGEDPGLPLKLFTTVLLQLRLEVTTELVQLTACGVVWSCRITPLQTTTLTDQNK